MDKMSDKIGLAHDYLLTMRGAERTFAQIAACWPRAPIYTTLCDREQLDHHFFCHEIKTSYLQYSRVRQRSFRRLLPLFPRAVEHLPVSDYDLIMSSSSGFAHGVRPGSSATHICYCHSPFRYAWHERDRALGETPAILRPIMDITLRRIKQWDLMASRRVTHYIANSKLTQQRIADSYGRDSLVIYPPVEIERFGVPKEPHDYFLFVGEVTGHKRVEVALEAIRRAGAKLKIVGDGPARERLTIQYGSAAEFLGRVSDQELNSLYAHTKALIVPNVEEFGIAAVEAQAAGRPVLAINKGGTSETVVDGITGVLVTEGTVDEFADALTAVDFSRFVPTTITKHAQQFSGKRFRHQISNFVGEKTNIHYVP